MRIEHRLQIEGRPADSFENLSSRGFSSKSIAQLSLELLDCASKVLLSLDGGCVGRHNCAQSIEWRLLVSAGRHTKRLSTHPTLCQSDAPCSVLARDVCFRAARSAAAPTDPCLSLAHIHRRSRPRFTSENGITCAEGKSLPARMKLSSRPGDSHPQALPEPCMTVSSHTAPDVQPLPWHRTQCAKRCRFARRKRSNQSRACRRRRRHEDGVDPIHWRPIGTSTSCPS